MPKTYTFTLTEQEANLMLNALANLPYGQVAQLIAKLQKQAEPQPEIDNG